MALSPAQRTGAATAVVMLSPLLAPVNAQIRVSYLDGNPARGSKNLTGFAARCSGFAVDRQPPCCPPAETRLRHQKYAAGESVHDPLRRRGVTACFSPRSKDRPGWDGCQ